MSKKKKRFGTLALGVVLGLGLLYPGYGMNQVKAAEQTEAEGWDVTPIKSDEYAEDASVEDIYDAASRDVEDTESSEDAGVDSLEVETNFAHKTVYGVNNYAAAYEVLGIVNQKRAEYGLEPLVMDRDLLDAAMLRAAELTISPSHTRPCGLDCWSVCYKAYGENIAGGYNTPSDVMTAWMNSSGHQSNILDSDYQSIGVGCFNYNGTNYWVQLFGIRKAAEVSQPANQALNVEVITDSSYGANYTLTANRIEVMYSDPRDGFIAYLVTNAVDIEDVEFSWYASADGGNSWFMISDWDSGFDGVIGLPNKFGDYLVVAKARKIGDDSTTVSSSFVYGYHPAIKGICQMPYTGAGGGYLIGIESYENPNHAYTYEMLILDCTLYAQGLPAWTYTTGRCGAPDTCLWTIWQPQYGYYWTLFRIYDENGTLIDEQCYGFANIC